MSGVNPVEAIKYGYELMAYLIAVNILGGIVAVIGSGIIAFSAQGGGDNIAVMVVGGLFGFVIFLIGYAAVITGYLRIGYKVIADGNETGVSSAH